MGGLTPGDAEGSKIGINSVHSHSEEIYVIRLSNADEIVAEHDDDDDDDEDNDNDEDDEREKEGFVVVVVVVW